MKNNKRFISALELYQKTINEDSITVMHDFIASIQEDINLAKHDDLLDIISNLLITNITMGHLLDNIYTPEEINDIVKDMCQRVETHKTSNKQQLYSMDEILDSLN
tara:strand:- start:5301 stop:5618 length:318 start_codon:yes stop_codon:yes gene_type:complete